MSKSLPDIEITYAQNKLLAEAAKEAADLLDCMNQGRVHLGVYGDRSHAVRAMLLAAIHMPNILQCEGAAQ